MTVIFESDANFTPLDKMPKLLFINQFIVSSFYLCRGIKKNVAKPFSLKLLTLVYDRRKGFLRDLNMVFNTFYSSNIRHVFDFRQWSDKRASE